MTTLATLGLSHHHLTQRAGTGLHRELLLHLPTDNSPPNATGVLFQVATELIDREYGLHRGEVIGPRGRLFDRGECTALYAAAPVYLPDSFSTLSTKGTTVVLTWLIPITTPEAEYVDSHGWNAFESLLVDENPDLTDPERRPLAGIHA